MATRVKADYVRDLILNLLSCNNCNEAVEKTYEDAYVVVTFQHDEDDNYEYVVYIKDGRENLKVFHRIKYADSDDANVQVFKRGKWIEYLEELMEADIDDTAIFQENRTQFQKIMDEFKELPFILRARGLVKKMVASPPSKSRVNQVE